MKLGTRRACLLASILASGSAYAEAPRVLASVAPVHSLVASVMEGVGEPDLLVPATASDHDYALKPSDVRSIAGAHLVVWVGEPLEAYLVKPIRTEAVPELELLDAPGVDPHRFADRGEAALAGEGEGHGAEDHAAESVEVREEGHGHEHAGLDPHVWLDPIRAQAIVRAVAAKLGEIDPANTDRYQANAAAAVTELSALDAEIRAELSPFKGRPFITFHDGYSYFVERYGLNQAAQLTADPDIRPGAASVRALREEVAAKQVACAFAEPQFDAGVLATLAGEVGIKVGVLDALGAGIEPGPALYHSLLKKNAAAMADCLAPTS